MRSYSPVFTLLCSNNTTAFEIIIAAASLFFRDDVTKANVFPILLTKVVDYDNTYLCNAHLLVLSASRRVGI